MSKQAHHEHHQHDHHATHGGKKIHHDWKFWAVILMLVGMGIYVLTMDEAFWPGGPVQEEVPAAE